MAMRGSSHRIEVAVSLRGGKGGKSTELSNPKEIRHRI